MSYAHWQFKIKRLRRVCSDRNITVWNKELLFVGGFLARAAYELEMATIKDLWNNAAQSEASQGLLEIEWRATALHVLRFFTFRGSTPLSAVSSEMRKAFFACAHPGRSFPIVSSAGIRDACNVRMPDSVYSGFLKQLPVVLEEFLTDSKIMISALREQGMLKDISYPDVFQELRKKPLSEQEMVFCLTWWINLFKEGADLTILPIRRQFIDAASVMTESFGQSDQRSLSLSTVKTFLDPRNVVIPTDGPLPDHLLPVAVGGELDRNSLRKSFPWAELTVAAWIEHVSNKAVRKRNVEFDLATSALWAEKVIGVLENAWNDLSGPDQTNIISYLKSNTCIPTSAGMKLPEDAYFSNADIFHDLPVVIFPSRDHDSPLAVEVLGRLGVRKHIDMELIFNRLVL